MHRPTEIVTANNVYANVDDLRELTEGIRGLLAPDGVFVLETGYVLDLVKNGVFDNIYHEQLSYYSAKPLVKYLSRHGMEMVDIEPVATKRGRCD